MNADAKKAMPPPDVGFFLEPGFDGCEATGDLISLLLGKLPNRDFWCVEFGAGADSHGSTTHRLIEREGYSAVLIEGDKERCQYHRDLYRGNPKIIVLEKYVGIRPDDETRLDQLLAGTPAPADLDFISIDIDGNDYHAWNVIQRYRPKLLMIEFNPTIPPEIAYIQPADPALSIGNSLAALIDLGKSKDYELVSVYGVNAFFVRKQDFPAFGIRDNSIHALWTKRDCVTYFFSGYDGRIFLAGCRQLPWSFNIPIQEARMQVLPKFLQKYPLSRNNYRIYQILKMPSQAAKKVLKRLAGKTGGR